MIRHSNSMGSDIYIIIVRAWNHNYHLLTPYAMSLSCNGIFLPKCNLNFLFGLKNLFDRLFISWFQLGFLFQSVYCRTMFLSKIFDYKLINLLTSSLIFTAALPLYHYHFSLTILNLYPFKYMDIDYWFQTNEETPINLHLFINNLRNSLIDMDKL